MTKIVPVFFGAGTAIRKISLAASRDFFRRERGREDAEQFRRRFSQNLSRFESRLLRFRDFLRFSPRQREGGRANFRQNFRRSRAAKLRALESPKCASALADLCLRSRSKVRLRKQFPPLFLVPRFFQTEFSRVFFTTDFFQNFCRGNAEFFFENAKRGNDFYSVA